MNEGKPVFYLDLKQTFYRLFVANSSSIFSCGAITVVSGIRSTVLLSAEVMMEKKRSTTLEDERKSPELQQYLCLNVKFCPYCLLN